ncbi:MAG: type II secretion system major pseudopilin GspG [Sedimenticola sp.]
MIYHNIRRTSQRAFTLIELIVVIALVAVLAAVVAPNLLGKASDANRKAAGIQLDKVSNAIELYRLETGRYPERLRDLIEQPSGLERWKGPYLKKQATLIDPWGNDLAYNRQGQHGPFDLISHGADGQSGGEGDDADIGHWE